MRHHRHCQLDEKIHQFKAGKLGLFGGAFLVLHLLFHVAEGLIVPAIIIVLHGEAATAETTELDEEETAVNTEAEHRNLHEGFRESLIDYSLLSSMRTGYFRIVF